MFNQHNKSKSKSNALDIEVLIEKVSKLPIPDTEKADLLRRFKENMMNPHHGEDESLTRIQNKYTPANLLPPISPPISLSMALPPPQPLQPPQLQPLQQPQPPQQPPEILPSYYPMQSRMPSDVMTTAHFEVLRNKMDSIQLELVDLLRHVKDYTQRYMNATRQQDMEKIDAYINGLFEVDKKMKRVEEQVAMTTEEAEPQQEEQQSTVARATNGIKNFLGGISNGVSSITNLVSNTAKIANDTLSKNVFSSTTSGPTTGTTSGTTTTPKTNIISNNQSNIISVDDYISTNSNALNIPATSNTSNTSNTSSINNPSNTIISNANKLNQLVETTEPNNPSETDVEDAISRLNETMNADIENTVNQGENIKISDTKSETNNSSSTNTTNPITVTQTGGGVSRLTKKIELLKLKLTKRRLENKLYSSHKTKTKHSITKLRNNQTRRYKNKN